MIVYEVIGKTAREEVTEDSRYFDRETLKKIMRTGLPAIPLTPSHVALIIENGRRAEGRELELDKKN